MEYLATADWMKKWVICSKMFYRHIIIAQYCKPITYINFNSQLTSGKLVYIDYIS